MIYVLFILNKLKSNNYKVHHLTQFAKLRYKDNRLITATTPGRISTTASIIVPLQSTIMPTCKIVKWKTIT